MSSRLSEVFGIKEFAPPGAGLKFTPEELELLVSCVEANHELTPQEKSGLMKKLQGA